MIMIALIVLIVFWIKYHVCQFFEVHLVGGDVVIGGHDLVGDALFAVDDVVERAVDGVATDEVVTGDVIFLADAVGTVLTLQAVGISPRELDKGDVR